MSANSFYGFGTRKEAIAKVQLIAGGSGNVLIRTGNVKNSRTKEALEYFKNPFFIQDFMYPLTLTNKAKSFDIHAHVDGGGIVAQASAIKLGIARALLEFDPKMKPAMKSYKLLTQNRKYKERKKVGKRGARRSPQFTKR